MTDYFDDYYFTSNVSDHTCPGFGPFVCQPPNACARDPNTGRRFCCDVKDVCWTITETCANDGSTIDCGTGTTTWCCVNGREECTATENQINICWSTHHDILNNITNNMLNNTYSSLSSAHPSATTWSFDPLALIAQTAPPTSSATSSAADTSATSGTSSTPSPTGSGDNNGNNTDKNSSLTGGAIAGIVVGSIAGVALIAAGLFFLWRRARNKNAAAAAAAGGYQAPGSGPPPGGFPEGANGLDDKPRYAGAPSFGGHDHTNSYYAGSSMPHLPPSSVPASELHGDNSARQELPANSRQELPASTAFGTHPSELSATSPSVATHYGFVSNAVDSPASVPAVPASGSAGVPPEQAYQQPYQAGTAAAPSPQQ